MGRERNRGLLRLRPAFAAPPASAALSLSARSRLEKCLDSSFFYDPVTKKLREPFALYPEALEARVQFAHDLDRTHSELLKRIQAERRR